MKGWSEFTLMEFWGSHSSTGEDFSLLGFVVTLWRSLLRPCLLYVQWDLDFVFLKGQLQMNVKSREWKFV